MNKSHIELGNQLTNTPGSRLRMTITGITLLLLQEVRKGGFFAALTSGLASREFSSRHELLDFTVQ